MLTRIADWLAAHPRATHALNKADAVIGRPVAKAVDWHVRRLNLRMQIRACGGRAPWHEGEGALRARLDRLARTGSGDPSPEAERLAVAFAVTVREAEAVLNSLGGDEARAEIALLYAARMHLSPADALEELFSVRDGDAP